MVDGFDSSGTNLITRGGQVKLSTATPQFNRVPQRAITLSAFTIDFPDMLKGYNYYYSQFDNTVPPGTHGEECIVGQKLIGQEWGPPGLGFSAHPLNDIDIGVAVPDGCDYLDVQANITRTTTPVDSAWGSPYYITHDWPIEFDQGAWLQLTDAALTVEHMGGFSRMFWFEIVGGRILLRRKQSVVSVDSNGAATATDGIIGVEYGFVAQASGSPPVIDKVTNPSKGELTPSNANGSGCITVATLNAHSVYTGTFKIVPCCTQGA